MLSPDASWLWFALAMLSLTAVHAIVRWLQGPYRRQTATTAQQATAQQATESLQCQIATLECRLVAVEITLQRLEAALHTRPSRPLTTTTLAAIEGVADDSQLDFSDVPGSAMSTIRLADPGALGDPFAGHRESIAIARLADQGHSAAEIARRLEKPLGEIELLLSLRPVREAA